MKAASSSLSADRRWRLHRTAYEAWRLPADRHRRLVRLWELLALLLLLWGVAGIARLIPFLGQPFPGFLWGPDVPPWMAVDYIVQLGETPWWGGLNDSLPKGIGPRIVAVNGEPIAGIPISGRFLDFGHMAVGTPVAYTVLRHPADAPRTVLIPLMPFTPGHFFEAYGLLFLTGLTTLGVGWVLAHRAADMPSFLLAGALLTLAGLALQHGWASCVTRCVPWHLWANWLNGNLVYMPAMVFTGTILFHFALLYPRPLLTPPVLARAVRLLYGFSLLYLLVGWGQEAAGRVLGSTFFVTMLLWFILGVGATTGRTVYAAFVGRTGESLMLGWALAGGSLLAILSGAVLFFGVVPAWLLTSLIYPADILYPLIVLYAVRNMALMSGLEEALEAARRLGQEVQELQKMHAKSLQDIADVLHDSVLADLKGVHLLVAAAAERSEVWNHPVGELVRRAARHLQETAVRLRGVVEGTRPVDFAREGLVRPLERLFEAARGLYGWRWHVELEVDEAYEMLPPAMREHVYWVVRSALVNSRDHAQAQRFEACLRCEREGEGYRFVMRLADDGVGFDVEAVMAKARENGHLGLLNMQRRVEEGLKGQMRIESAPGGRGTVVWVTFWYQGEEEGEEEEGETLAAAGGGR